MIETRPDQPAAAAAPGPAAPAGPPPVDLQALAEKLLRLLRAELRVERERLGPPRRPRPGG